MTPTTYTLTLTVETDADRLDLLELLQTAIHQLESDMNKTSNVPHAARIARVDGRSYGYSLWRPDEAKDNASVPTHKEQTP
jgi:hypothetical protein